MLRLVDNYVGALRAWLANWEFPTQPVWKFVVKSAVNLSADHTYHLYMAGNLVSTVTISSGTRRAEGEIYPAGSEGLRLLENESITVDRDDANFGDTTGGITVAEVIFQ